MHIVQGLDAIQLAKSLATFRIGLRPQSIDRLGNTRTNRPEPEHPIIPFGGKNHHRSLGTWPDDSRLGIIHWR